MSDDSTQNPARDKWLPPGLPDVHQRGDLGKWWGQGARSAFLQRVDWAGLRVTPGIMACLVIAPALVAIGAARLYVIGQAEFFSPALLFGWLGTVVAAWASWLLVPQRRGPDFPGPPTAAHLFAMLVAQALIVMLVTGFMGVLVARGMPIAPVELHRQVYRVTIGVLWIWSVVAQVGLVWRVAATDAAPRWIASIVLLASFAAHAVFEGPSYWYVAPTQANQNQAQEPFRLTQELIELQPLLLREKLAGIKPGPAGVTSMYAITFSPYAAEDVFRRESALVAGVMQERFGATDRTIQLVNSSETSGTWPWATPLNLKRAIGRMAEVMNREQDVLFVHLTSHGARDGQLSADFEPLTVGVVTPAVLSAMLDEAGIRYRVISVSACYSGSWIEPLANFDTLVMTAADADHTSYGCGRGSELTYFGRAMYAEALQTTWSFEQAHATARTVIDQRERAAGKDDGFSNPQIRVGETIRAKLAQFAAQRQVQQ